MTGNGRLTGVHDPLDNFHVVDIERADGVAFVIGLLNISLVFTSGIVDQPPECNPISSFSLYTTGEKK